MSYLLDTNIVSAILRKNQAVIDKLHDLEFCGVEVFISCMTYYEIKRDLMATNATKQLADFNRWLPRMPIIFLSNIEIIERASAIHVDLKRSGQPIGDADILIAATAMSHDLTLVSHDSDMLRVSGLTVEDWLGKV